MAMQELNQAEVAEVSGAYGSGLAGILGNLPTVLFGAPIILLNLLGLRNDGATIENYYGFIGN